MIPYADYLRLLEALEDKADAVAVAEFQVEYRAGREFLVPAEILV